MIEGRERLRLLSMEMELQRAWLAAYLEDTETRAALRRRNMVWRLITSVARTRSVWVAALGAGLEWWRQRQMRRSSPA
jgi:hypothetical protein